jgi:hypothetical protein
LPGSADASSFSGRQRPRTRTGAGKPFVTSSRRPAEVPTNAGADDALAEQLRSLLRERHQGHAAHGVASDDDRSRGRDGVEDGAQVASELLEVRASRPVRPERPWPRWS